MPRFQLLAEDDCCERHFDADGPDALAATLAAELDASGWPAAFLQATTADGWWLTVGTVPEGQDAALAWIADHLEESWSAATEASSRPSGHYLPPGVTFCYREHPDQ